MRKICVVLSVLVFGSVSAQVGVNTILPLKPLHIDGKKDNSSTGTPTADQIKNDVVVDEEGRLGIGTLTPEAKLDVKGDTNIEGKLNINSEVTIAKGTGEDGAYLMSQGAGKAPKWYKPAAAQQGDMTNVQDYTFLMLDGNGNSTAVNVEELFQKYLSTLTIPSVEFFASSTGEQPLKKEYNTISVFKPELTKSKTLKWNTAERYIEILEDGKYLFSMQIGVSMLKTFVNENTIYETVMKSSTKNVNIPISSVLNRDIIIGFTSRNPVNAADKNKLWIGRGAFRVQYATINDIRGFTSYSTLLELKKGDKVYPTIYLSVEFGDDNVKLQGVQDGNAGSGVLTNLTVTKY